MREKRGRVLAIGVALVLGGYLAAGYARSSQWIGNHPEWRKIKASPSDYGLRSQLVSFPSTDGIALKAWWLPAQNEARFLPSIILAHGRDDNRSGMLPRAAFLVRSGNNVLDLDLRNHGESEGNYVTPGYLEALDVVGGVDFLRDQGERGPIGVLGFSYGAVAGLHAAVRTREILAVVADSAFISNADLRDRVAHSSQVPLKSKVRAWLGEIPLLDSTSDLIFRLRTGVKLSGEEVDCLSVIDRITDRPILFVSGERDWMAPPENARRMYERAHHPQKALMIVPGAGHNESYTGAREEYERQVLGFFRKALAVGGMKE
jgi:dipeptidyl aminopeptidase/acylaminoacyl peptidase